MKDSNRFFGKGDFWTENTKTGWMDPNTHNITIPKILFFSLSLSQTQNSGISLQNMRKSHFQLLLACIVKFLYVMMWKIN